MLVLTRKLKESIRIGDDITVTIVRVKGNAVRIGIEAPPHVRVIRGELNRRVDRVGGILEDRVRRGESVVIEQNEFDASEELSDEWSREVDGPMAAEVVAS